MTILAITNPMGTQPQSTAAQAATTLGVLQPTNGIAVQPSPGASSGGGSGSATSYSGFGAGSGGQAAQGFGITQKATPRPTDATPDSVVGAQTATQSKNEEPKVIDTAQKARETAAAMPDPLPTSPFLRMIEGDPPEG